MCGQLREISFLLLFFHLHVKVVQRDLEGVRDEGRRLVDPLRRRVHLNLPVLDGLRVASVLLEVEMHLRPDLELALDLLDRTALCHNVKS